MATGHSDQNTGGHKELELELELEITGLATGGEGVARLEGRVVFVPGGLPGDRVRVQILEDRGRFLRGRIAAIVTPSLDRRPPPCPIADRCGGCPWMGLNDAAQLEAKQAQVAELLARVGGLSRDLVRPIVASERTLEYRNRLRLHVERDRIGFREGSSRQVVDVSRCRVAMPELTPLLEAARTHLVCHFPLLTPLQLELYLQDDNRLLLGVSGARAALFRRFAPSLALPLEVRIDERPLDPRGTPRLPFAQANPFQNRRIIEAVVKALETTPSSHVLDLYAGAGNFSLPLASQVEQVVGIEYSAAAVEEANRRAPKNAQYQSADVVKALEAMIRRKERFDRVVLDPPRAGAREACGLLAQLQPRRVAYVSCDPATLARDLKQLTAQGFRLEGVQPFDLMPQTSHVECLAILSR